MCPLTCEIVKAAIEAHETRGIIMQEYIDYHKKHNAKCAICTRNENVKKDACNNQNGGER